MDNSSNFEKSLCRGLWPKRKEDVLERHHVHTHYILKKGWDLTMEDVLIRTTVKKISQSCPTLYLYAYEWPINTYRNDLGRGDLLWVDWEKRMMIVMEFKSLRGIGMAKGTNKRKRSKLSSQVEEYKDHVKKSVPFGVRVYGIGVTEDVDVLQKVSDCHRKQSLLENRKIDDSPSFLYSGFL